MKNLLLAFLLLFQYCTSPDCVDIPESIEIALYNQRGTYREYRNIVQNACKNSKAHLLALQKVDYLYDATGYDHGCVLLNVMKSVGDERFSNEIMLLSSAEQQNLRNYIEAGADSYHEQEYESLLKNYPRTFNLLRLQN